MSDSIPRDDSLPLDSWHRERGARMVSFAGYQMPIQYEGIIAEHLWTRQAAGLFDVSHMGQLLIAGAGAEQALESLLPADLVLLKEGRLRYSLLLTEEGGIIDDLMITRRGDHWYMVVNGATRTRDLEHLRERLPATVVVDHMREQALLALQGPKAADVLARFAPGVRELSFMTGAPFTLGGITTWISRSGYTGEDGFELSIPATRVGEIATLIAAQPEVKPVGLGARDSLRLEAGLPLYGHDLAVTTTPIEAGLDFAISKRRRGQGGFAGWHRIIAQIDQGPSRRRVGLKIEGRQPVREGALVLDSEGREAGVVTSGGFSPSLQSAIAMAYVPAAFAEPGMTITVSQRGKMFEAAVATMPFVPHRYQRKGAV